jgi:hypothetical protein
MRGWARRQAGAAERVNRNRTGAAAAPRASARARARERQGRCAVCGPAPAGRWPPLAGRASRMRAKTVAYQIQAQEEAGARGLHHSYSKQPQKSFDGGEKHLTLERWPFLLAPPSVQESMPPSTAHGSPIAVEIRRDRDGGISAVSSLVSQHGRSGCAGAALVLLRP